jgi:hypothetical protein
VQPVSNPVVGSLVDNLVIVLWAKPNSEEAQNTSLSFQVRHPQPIRVRDRAQRRTGLLRTLRSPAPAVDRVTALAEPVAGKPSL